VSRDELSRQPKGLLRVELESEINSFLNAVTTDEYVYINKDKFGNFNISDIEEGEDSFRVFVSKTFFSGRESRDTAVGAISVICTDTGYKVEYNATKSNDEITLRIELLNNLSEYIKQQELECHESFEQSRALIDGILESSKHFRTFSKRVLTQVVWPRNHRLSIVNDFSYMINSLVNFKINVSTKDLVQGSSYFKDQKKLFIEQQNIMGNIRNISEYVREEINSRGSLSIAKKEELDRMNKQLQEHSGTKSMDTTSEFIKKISSIASSTSKISSVRKFERNQTMSREIGHENRLNREIEYMISLAQTKKNNSECSRLINACLNIMDLTPSQFTDRQLRGNYEQLTFKLEESDQLKAKKIIDMKMNENSTLMEEWSEFFKSEGPYNKEDRFLSIEIVTFMLSNPEIPRVVYNLIGMMFNGEEFGLSVALVDLTQIMKVCEQKSLEILDDRDETRKLMMSKMEFSEKVNTWESSMAELDEETMDQNPTIDDDIIDISEDDPTSSEDEIDMDDEQIEMNILLDNEASKSHISSNESSDKLLDRIIDLLTEEEFNLIEDVEDLRQNFVSPSAPHVIGVLTQNTEDRPEYTFKLLCMLESFVSMSLGLEPNVINFPSKRGVLMNSIRVEKDRATVSLAVTSLVMKGIITLLEMRDAFIPQTLSGVMSSSDNLGRKLSARERAKLKLSGRQKKSDDYYLMSSRIFSISEVSRLFSLLSK
jgi:hypothetical protein